MTFKWYLISAHIVLMKEDIHKSFIRKHQVRERGDDFVVFSDILTLVRARTIIGINSVIDICRNSHVVCNDVYCTPLIHHKTSISD